MISQNNTNFEYVVVFLSETICAGQASLSVIVGIAQEATPVIQEMVNEESDLSFVFRGYIAGHAESRRRTIIGSVVLLFVLFALLAIPNLQSP